jgi:hypothetical protein
VFGTAPLDLNVSFSSQQNKFIALQHTHNTTTSSLQRELDATRQSVDLYKAQVRDLELGNDDLERNERQATSSLVDIEQKYAKLIEDKILLEHELQDKAAVEEACQRLRDELRGKPSHQPPLLTTT